MTRPIYFIVSFWGERFRKLFVERCLPSLGTTTAHKLIIACPEPDWRALCEQIVPLEGHTEWLPISYPEDGSEAAKFRHMNLTHRLLVDYVHQRRGLACQVMPDSVYSPGFVAYLEDRAAQGDHAVLLPQLRLEEKGFSADLAYRLPFRSCLVRNLWPTAPYYFWHSREFARWPSHVFWNAELKSPWPTIMEGQGEIAHDDELIMHTAGFNYALLDLAVPETIDWSSFDEGLSIENRWLSDNFKDLSKIHVVQDDRVLCASDTPLPELLELPPATRAISFLKGYRFRRMRELYRRMGDPIKADVMRYPIRYVRLKLVDNSIGSVIDPAHWVMRRYFGDAYREFATMPRFRDHLFWAALRSLIWCDLTARDVMRKLRRILRRENAPRYAHRSTSKGALA